MLTDCRVPLANQVSGGDAGSREWILIERLFIAARCCGAALRLLDEASAWAQEREAFGGPIFENQGVSFPLADSLTELHAARLMTYHAAQAFDVLADRTAQHVLGPAHDRVQIEQHGSEHLRRPIQNLGALPGGQIIEEGAGKHRDPVCQPRLALRQRRAGMR